MLMSVTQAPTPREREVQRSESGRNTLAIVIIVVIVALLMGAVLAAVTVPMDRAPSRSIAQFVE
jgi:hypothetical protein